MNRTLLWFTFIGLFVALMGCTTAGQPLEEEVAITLPAETAVVTSEASPATEDSATLTPEIAPITATLSIIEEVTVPVSPTIPMPSSPTIQQWVTQAKEDLAGRLNVTTDEIGLVEFKPVVWPDSSLGCPQPGMAYTQVQQDGYLIRLQVKKEIYDYHGGGTRGPFLCEKADGENPEPPPGAGNE